MPVFMAFVFGNLGCVRKQSYLCIVFRITYIEFKERKLIMTVLFLVTFVVAVCIAEAVKVNNDINLGLK